MKALASANSVYHFLQDVSWFAGSVIPWQEMADLTNCSRHRAVNKSKNGSGNCDALCLKKCIISTYFLVILFFKKNIKIRNYIDHSILYCNESESRI